MIFGMAWTSGLEGEVNEMKEMYKLVGKIEENDGIRYILDDGGHNVVFTKEQVAFLVGSGQVVNCTGYISGDKFILRGKGMSIEHLPVYCGSETSEVVKVAESLVEQIKARHDIINIQCRNIKTLNESYILFTANSRWKGVTIDGDIKIYAFEGKVRYKIYLHKSGDYATTTTVKFKEVDVLYVLHCYLEVKKS